MAQALEVLWVALRLGLTSFGGPIAHLAYFRDEYVERRKWLNDRTFADLVALCQVLPGPASSQVGIAIGMLRGGFLGGILSWIGFTLPSAVALVLFAYLLGGYNIADAGWLHGLIVVAVAVVAHAVWGMAQHLTPDRERASVAIGAAAATLLIPGPTSQVVVIGLAGFIGWLFFREGRVDEAGELPVPISRGAAAIAWVAFLSLLALLPIARQLVSYEWLAMTDSFFRVGSLVFGGGHVVLPLLSAEVTAPGWVTETEFLAGYGAAQAVPGPLFTFAAYLGATMGGWWMAIIAVAAIFLPSLLIITGALPFWNGIRSHASIRSALNGVNAAVVGILLAALYDPVSTKALRSPGDFALALAGFALIKLWKVPAWAVAAFSAVAGAVMGKFA